MDLMQQVWRIRHADGADADSADTSESQAEGKTSQGSTAILSQGDHTAATTLQGSSSSGGGGRPARLNLKPLATSTGSALAGSATIPEWHGIPPPPPRNLPHGWTARYDEKEKKYAYAHGVTAQEQWDFPADTSEWTVPFPNIIPYQPYLYQAPRATRPVLNISSPCSYLPHSMC